MSNTTAERRKKAKEIMSKHGLTLKEWAKRNGVSVNLVNAVINNKTPCSINKGHKVAVLLGLKKGVIIE
jgi:gp16 family phage-associated protein